MSTVTTWDEIWLAPGPHGPEWRGEACAVELSNLIAAKKVVAPPELLQCDRPLEPVAFTDDHPSISRVVRSYVVTLDDGWDDEQRQKLKPYAAKILCTATGDADEKTRAWMATDWLVRVYAPAFLRLAGLEEHARALEGLPRIADATLASAAQPTIDAARTAAAAAWDAAPVAAWAAAGEAAGAAAWAAAGEAAGDTALAAAGDTALAAAGDTALAAARDAAGAAAGAAWDVWNALNPVVGKLQEQALVLLDQMIEVGR